MNELWAAYAAAFALGAGHALEVDHMVAVTVFVGGRPRLGAAGGGGPGGGGAGGGRAPPPPPAPRALAPRSCGPCASARARARSRRAYPRASTQRRPDPPPPPPLDQRRSEEHTSELQ